MALLALSGAVAERGGWWLLAVPVAAVLAAGAMAGSAPYADDRQVLQDRRTFAAMLLVSLLGLVLALVMLAGDGPAWLGMTGIGLLYVPYLPYGRTPTPTP